ncbi:MAG TPA: rhomboid family intramembrane serine protease [Anaeromyxobacteraceae bacterium]|nr:rhomboid family intramembrane serine protease [Anaeromyxobacteraceae bacterium]
MSATRGLGQGLSFGGRVPVAVGALIAVTVVASLVGVVGERNGLPLLQLGVLEPGRVLRGELWRLVTWVFFETDPLGLLFGGLVLYWFGRDLCEAWGERRFVLAYVGFAAAAAALATGVALLFPALLHVHWLGLWPAVDALVVAWALNFPYRQILLYFALPVSGRALLWFTVGGTLLYAVFSGLAAFVPHLLAEGAAYLYASGRGPGRWLRRLKLPRFRKRRQFSVVHADRDPDRRWLN